MARRGTGWREHRPNLACSLVNGKSASFRRDFPDPSIFLSLCRVQQGSTSPPRPAPTRLQRIRRLCRTRGCWSTSSRISSSASVPSSTARKPPQQLQPKDVLVKALHGVQVADAQHHLAKAEQHCHPARISSGIKRRDGEESQPPPAAARPRASSPPRTPPARTSDAHTTRYTNLAADRFKTFWRD